MHSDIHFFANDTSRSKDTENNGQWIEVGLSLFFCDFQSKNAEFAPFFVHFNKK